MFKGGEYSKLFDLPHSDIRRQGGSAALVGKIINFTDEFVGNNQVGSFGLPTAVIGGIRRGRCSREPVNIE